MPAWLRYEVFIEAQVQWQIYIEKFWTPPGVKVF